MAHHGDSANYRVPVTLHATHAQLAEFLGSGEFGYALMLYGEYFSESPAEDIPVIFNGFSGAVNQ